MNFKLYFPLNFNTAVLPGSPELVVAVDEPRAAAQAIALPDGFPAEGLTARRNLIWTEPLAGSRHLCGQWV